MTDLQRPARKVPSPTHCQPTNEILRDSPFDISRISTEDVQKLVLELQMLADNVPESFAYVGMDQRYRFVNKQFEVTFGLSQAEIIGKHIRELEGEEAYQLLRPHITAVLSGRTASFERRIEAATGRRWTSVNYAPRKNDGQIDGFFATISDITERKAAKAELEREKSLFESVVRSVPDALMLATLDRVISFCNPGVKRVFGYEPQELIGQPTSILYADAKEHERQGKVRFHAEADEHFELSEIEFRRKNGVRFIGEMVGTIVRRTDGQPEGFLGLIRDISQRKQLELEHHRYHRVLESLYKGTPLKNLIELVVQFAEEARPGMLGSILLLDKENLCLRNGYAASLPLSFNESIDGVQIGPDVGSCGTAAFTGQRVIVADIESHPYWKDYRELAAAANVRACWSEPILSPNHEILGTLAMYFRQPQTPNESDLQLLEHCAHLAGIAIDRARADELIKTSEERLGLAFRATNDAIWDYNVTDGTVWRNNAYCDQFGRPDNSDSLQWWIRHIHPDDRDRVVISLQAFASGQGDSDRWSNEFRFRRLDGSHAVVVDRAFRACDENGKPIRVIGCLRDITERRALEKEVLDISAEEHRRIGNDLHDGIGQELTGLSMAVDALITALSRKSLPEVEIARKIEAGVKRSLKQVRALARGMNPVDVDARGLMSALSEMSQRLTDLYQVGCSFECDEPVLLRDNQTATQLFRIAQEATTNAIKHGKAKRITISLARSNGVALLRILDDGIGFDNDSATNSGMGLRIMGYRSGIIGGQLQVKPRKACGTEVTCILPHEAIS